MHCAIGGVHAHEGGVVNGETFFSVELLGLHRLLTAPFHIPNVRAQCPMKWGEEGDFTEGSPNVNLKNSHRSVKGVPWAS